MKLLIKKHSCKPEALQGLFKHQLLKTTALLTVFFALVVSCASKPVVIPEDLTAAELVQRAQEASDRNHYNISLQYYQTILERFSFDAEYVFAAEYEIAFIHYKQKKYELSKAGFNDLLDRYNTPDEELLPPQYKILANKVLAAIAEIENRKKASAPEEST